MAKLGQEHVYGNFKERGPKVKRVQDSARRRPGMSEDHSAIRQDSLEQHGAGGST